MYSIKTSCRLGIVFFMLTVICTVFPDKLSAYVIDGSTVTLEASDQTADNTVLIQTFLNNSNYTKIIIPPGPGNASWLVCPLFINHDNTEIHLNANAVLEAKPQGYPWRSDKVLTAVSKGNIKITGDTGAEILMHKEEYASLAESESRHAIFIQSSSNVIISDLLITNAGGDGIYLGDVTNQDEYCSDVTISNVDISGSARNALSVISVDGLTVSDSIFQNTAGQGNAAMYGPWAGVDFEPNGTEEVLNNISFDNCLFLNNNGSGIMMTASILLGTTSETVDISFTNIIVAGSGKYGLGIYGVPGYGAPNSTILFENCTVKDSDLAGIYVGGKSEGGGILYFEDCYLNGNGIGNGDSPILIDDFITRPDMGVSAGNIQFNNVTIDQNNYSEWLLSHWQFNEGVGTAASDCIGNCSGTLFNSPGWITGKVGNALVLNGTNQYMEVTSNSSALDIGTDDFSVTMWFQRSSDTAANKRLLYKGASSDTDTGYTIAGSDTHLSFLISNGSDRISVQGTIPSLNEWHHVACTVDREDKMRIYIDGIFQNEIDISSWSSADISNSHNFFIGGCGGASLCWPGKVDEVKVYRRALVEEEIMELALSASSAWQLDEGSGTTAADSVGNCSGTLYNSPTWTSGVTGSGLGLNGTNQYVEIGDNSSLDIGTGDFSVSMWFQRSSDTAINKRLLYKGASSSTDTGYAIAGSDDNLTFLISDGTSRLSVKGTISSLDQWHHVVCTVDRNDKMRIYIDGNLEGQISMKNWDGLDIDSSHDLLIGAAINGSLCWPGKVDDVKIYKRCLRPEEVTEIAVSPSIVWQFNEGSGTTAYDNIGNCSGTLYNSPGWTSGKAGKALELDGTDQYMEVTSNSSELDIGVGDFSIAVWFQRSSDTASNKRLIYKGASSSTDTGYAVYGSDTSLGFFLCNGTIRRSVQGSIPSLNEWHYAVLTVQRDDKMRLYIDGSLQNETDISDWDGTDISNSHNFMLGGCNGAYLCWPGKVDELKVYRRALSSSEIERLTSPFYAIRINGILSTVDTVSGNIFTTGAMLIEDAVNVNVSISSNVPSNLWKLDDGSGDSALDSNGNCTGTLCNDPVWTTGKTGNALQLNGADQYVEVTSNSSELDIGTDDFSISMWFQRSTDTAINKRLLYKGSSSDTDTGYTIAGSDTQLSFLISNGTDRFSVKGDIPSLNEWHHVVCTVDRSDKMCIYINGVFQNELDVSSWSNTNISNSHNFFIGGCGGASLCWPGKVDNIRIYRRELTAGEAEELYLNP